MKNTVFNQSVRSILTCAASSLALLACDPIAMAQIDGGESTSQQISIPAGMLNQSILAISEAYGVDILASNTLIDGKRGASISGAMTVEQALEQVLDGSGLVARRADGDAFIIEQAEIAPPSQVRQNRRQASPETDDVIIIQGAKLETSLQNFETSVELFDADRLDREAVVNLLEVFQRIPNVAAGGGLGNDFSIRGIGRNGVATVNTGIASNVYVDGAPLSRNAMRSSSLSLWDAGQVEVLRGPQSSVQGRNALAGAIFISTNDPTWEPEARLRITYGTHETYQAAGVVSGPLIDGQLAGRLSVDVQSTDGFIFHTVAQRQSNDEDGIHLRGKLLFEPDAFSDLSSKLTIDYIDGENGDVTPRVSTGFGVTSPELRTYDFTRYENSSNYARNQAESLRVVNENTYDLTDNWVFRTLFTYEYTENFRTFGLEDDLELFGGFTTNLTDSDIFSAETRFEFNYDYIRGFLGGYYYQEERSGNRVATEIFANLIAPLPSTPGSLLSLNETNSNEIENYAVFGQLEWIMSDRWRLNLGFRYDNEEVTTGDAFRESSVTPEDCVATVPGSQVGVPLPFVQVPCQTLVDLVLGSSQTVSEGFSGSFDAFLPRIALTYDINDNSSVFLSYQRGYRAGGSRFALTPQGQGQPNINVLNTYDPEYLDTIETGMRNVLFDGQLIANFNLFYSKYRDQQIILSGPIPEIVSLDDTIENAGESTLYGAEITLDYDLNESWNLFASVGLLQTEFDDFEYGPAGSDFESLAGNEFPFAPNLTYTLGAVYEHPSGLYANGTLTFTGEQFSDPANLTGEDFARAFEDRGLDSSFAATLTEEIDSFTNTTINAGYRTDTFNLFVSVANLFNEEGLRNVSYGTASSETGELRLASPVRGQVRVPRTVRVGIEVNF